jgi:hypothetical protein
MSFSESRLIESKNATISASSKTEYERILEPASAAWPGRLDYTQQPFASSASQRATGRPPSVASASTCFPDADPTMPPRDRLLRFQVRVDAPNKKQGMSARLPDKRFVCWDCAHALPTAQGTFQRFWLGPILRCPQRDQGELAVLLQSLCENPLAS